MGEELEDRPPVRALAPRRGRRGARSAAASARSAGRTGRPDGQAVTHAMQPRQWSKCVTISSETSRALLVADAHQHDAPARRVHLLLEDGVARARRQAEAAVHAVARSGRGRAGGARPTRRRAQRRWSRDAHQMPPTKAPGRKMPRRVEALLDARHHGQRAGVGGAPGVDGGALGRARRAARTRAGASAARTAVDALGRSSPGRARSRTGRARRGRRARRRPRRRRGSPRRGRSGGPETLSDAPSAGAGARAGAPQLVVVRDHSTPSSPASRSRVGASPRAWSPRGGAAEAHEHGARRRRARRRRGSRPRAAARPARRGRAPSRSGSSLAPAAVAVAGGQRMQPHGDAATISPSVP